jgi:uncharacterized cupin superfamily protein
MVLITLEQNVTPAATRFAREILSVLKQATLAEITQLGAAAKPKSAPRPAKPPARPAVRSAATRAQDAGKSRGGKLGPMIRWLSIGVRQMIGIAARGHGSSICRSLAARAGCAPSNAAAESNAERQAAEERARAMIVRGSQVPAVTKDGRAPEHGAFESLRYSDAGGLTQFGAYVETLQPGSQSSTRHWHEKEDEFLFVIAGEVTVIENDGAHTLAVGDAAGWPAGVANAHTVVNRSASPCSYLIMGTRLTHDVCHYPDVGRTLFTEGETWRLVASDGSVIKSGRT